MSKSYFKEIRFRSPDSVISLGKNHHSDRLFVGNFFIKNYSYKVFDVKTTDYLILLIKARSVTLKSFIELLLSKLLTRCNFPSIVVMLLYIATSTGNQFQPLRYIIMKSKKNQLTSVLKFSIKIGMYKIIKSRSSSYKNANINQLYQPQTLNVFLKYLVGGDLNYGIIKSAGTPVVFSWKHYERILCPEEFPPMRFKLAEELKLRARE